MKSLALLVLLTGVAGATERYPLFPDHHVADESALRSAESVARACVYSEMSRIGPNHDQVAKCNAAESKLLSFGPRAIPAVLQTLDGTQVSFTSMSHLYDVLARLGDDRVVGPLIAALEHLEAQEPVDVRSQARRFDSPYITRTLARITHADLESARATEWRKWDDARRAQPTQTAKAELDPAS